MKKLIVLLLLVSCSSEAVQVEEPPVTVVITTSTTSTTSTTVDSDQMADDFLEYFKENQIKGYIKLTEEETEKTYNLHMNSPEIFFWGEYTCYDNNDGMTEKALLDEYFPIFFENKYYFDEEFAVEDLDKNRYVYRIIDTYKCKLTYDDAENPDFISLYGRPFYQSDTWWIFEEKENEPIPVDTPGYFTTWATRVELIDFEVVYKEWVSDSIPPEIVFYNCPESSINGEIYNLEWGIISGNSDIDYLRIAIWKNGEYYTRVYFEKENHSDIFPFPLANTETYFEQPVSRPDEDGEIILEVFFATDDYYGNSTEASCIVTFEE